MDQNRVDFVGISRKSGLWVLGPSVWTPTYSIPKLTEEKVNS